jgi:predicted flap endonuclease-1-like 5' DNA nuclease
MFHKYRFLSGLLVVSLALTAFSPFQAAEQQGGIPWWVWLLIILVLLALLLWWWLGCRSKEKVAPTTEAEAGASYSVTAAPAPAEEPAPPMPDDLTRIEGIGPKISSLLQAAGIMTFAQLAAAEVDRLDHIVRDAGITIADPGTWPEQARLAAAGEWRALEVLQDELKGGRRV